jgi:hypothetical protein
VPSSIVNGFSLKKQTLANAMTSVISVDEKTPTPWDQLGMQLLSELMLSSMKPAL